MKKIILILFLMTGVTALVKAQDTTKVKKTPEERAEHMVKVMQKKLDLTADQTKQIGTVLTDRADKMAQIEGVKGFRMAKMQAMTDADKKIEAILTDSQKKTYAQMKADMKEKAMSRRNAANTPSPTAPPAQ